MSAGVWLQAAAVELRIENQLLWLTARDEPLTGILEQFARAGIEVEADPAVSKNVSGSWRAADAEKVLDEILAPCSYVLDWRRESGPLGAVTRLTGIRVYRRGHAEAVRPLRVSPRIETASDGRVRFLAREILVGFGPGATADTLKAFLARTGGTVIGISAELGIYRILLPEGANVLELAAQATNDRSIALAEPNYVYDLPVVQSGGEAGSVARWTAPSGESTVAVAVLDSGLLADASLSRAVIGAYDATRPSAPLTADAAGHGTLMARLASGLLDPFGSPVGEGVPVVAVKAFTDDGFADAFTLMNAITYAASKSSGPVSLSWGSETPSQFVENAVQYAIRRGRPVFAAVGNENTGRPVYPAAFPGVIGVAASDGNQLADYSNRGGFVDLIAPGTAGGARGTSVATAYAAHVAALYMRRNPGASAEDAVAAMKKAAGPDGMLTEEAVRRLLVK